MKTSSSLPERTRLVHGLILGLCIWLRLAPEAAAIIADPKPFVHTQPDGTKVTLRLRGDEFFHWHEDLQGFTVVRVGGRFEYARLNAQNALEATGSQAGQAIPQDLGLNPGLLPPREARPVNANQSLTPYRPWAAARKGGNGQELAANGTVKNLVILCKFRDHTNGVHTRAREDYDVLFNQPGTNAIAPTGSVRDAYLENSYGTVTIQSTVLAWVTLPQTQSYYAGTNNGLGGDYPNNGQRMVEDALALADPLVDFGQFDVDQDSYIDAITVIHSGYGAETPGAPANSIWSHKSYLTTPWESADPNAEGMNVNVFDYHTEPALWGNAGNEIVRIGVICHELGHFFGLPDLYDTVAPGNGIGSWCMMANSWGFDGSQLQPPHFSAWCKTGLGWVTPTLLSAAGTYSVTQAETAPSVYKITQGFPPFEYLLIENRQPVGLDSNIPQGGLAIWHIDETVLNNDNEGGPWMGGWPENGRHYRVALLQADGHYLLENGVNNIGDATDLYRAGGVNAISTNTVPNTGSYQFGIVHPTFNVINNISASAATMSFIYNYSPAEYWLDRTLFCTAFETGASTCTPVLFGPYKTYAFGTSATPGGSILRIRSANYPATNATVNKYLKLQAESGPSTIGKP